MKFRETPTKMHSLFFGAVYRKIGSFLLYKDITSQDRRNIKLLTLMYCKNLNSPTRSQWYLYQSHLELLQYNE